MFNTIKITFTTVALLLVFTINLSAYGTTYDTISVMGDVGMSSPRLQDEKDKASLSGNNSLNIIFGGSLMYNSLRLGITTFAKGARYTFSYHMFNQDVVSPYIGVSYIYGSKSKYNMSQTSFYHMDHTDLLFGLSVRLFTYFNPYVEYETLSSAIYVGMRIKFSYNLNKN